MTATKKERRGRPRNNPGIRWSGAAFKYVLSERECTMSELGQWLEVSTSTVSTWARYPSGDNSRPPSKDTAESIANYFQVPLKAFSSTKEAKNHA